MTVEFPSDLYKCKLCERLVLTQRKALLCPGTARCNAQRQAARELERASRERWLYCGRPEVVGMLRSAGLELRGFRDRWEWYVEGMAKGWPTEGRLYGPEGAVRVICHGPPLERCGLLHENSGDYPEAYDAAKELFRPTLARPFSLPFATRAVKKRWAEVRRSLLAEMAVDPGMLARIARMDTPTFRILLVGWWDYTPRASSKNLWKKPGKSEGT